MSYDLQTDPDERVVFFEEVPPERLGDEPFVFAITDRAVYFPKSWRFADPEPGPIGKVELSQVHGVRVERVRSGGLITLGAVLTAAAVLTFALNPGSLRDLLRGAHLATAGSAILAGAIGRRALVVTTAKGRHVWRRPLRATRAFRERIDEVLDRVAEATRCLVMLPR